MTVSEMTVWTELVIVMTLLMTDVCTVSGANPRFRGDAAKFMEVGFKTLRRQGTNNGRDFTKIEISAQPLEMVEDHTDIDTDRVTLEIKPDGGTWTVVVGEPSMRAGVYRWMEAGVEPCKEHSVRIWIHGQNTGQSVFEYPSPIPRATSQQLAESQFVPESPKLLTVSQISESSALVSWSPSACVDMYLVTYESVSTNEDQTFSLQTTETSLLVSSLDSCTEYELRVTSITGSQYSDETSLLVVTKPDMTAAHKLNPTVNVTSNSVSAQWKAFDALSCITEYSVSVCLIGAHCETSARLVRDDALSLMKFESEENLSQCSDYSLRIKPLFEDLSLEDAVIPVRTLSQPVEDLASLLTSVEAEAGEEQMVSVTWNMIQCASSYQVFHKVNTELATWEKIGTTQDNIFTSKGVPCTEYKYGVKVVIDDHESDIVEFKEAIMTNIDQSVPYVAANLVISPGADGASLSWDHGKCIQGYTIKVCHMMETKDRKCYEEAVPILESHTNKITHTVRNLQSCSHYNLQILPMTEGTKLTAETRSFMTGSPPASPPQEVTVTLNGDTNKVDISWSKVECAHGYRIHQKLENSDTEIKWDSDGLSVSLESPEPCVTYSYGVSAIVGEQESVTTQLQQVHVPPRQGGNTQHPVLVIQEKVNGSVTFIIDTADINRRCKVGQYQVRSNSVDKMFDSESLEGGRMTVEVPGEDTGPIQVRIHYTDFAIWSPWVSSASPRQEAFSMSGSMMVPLVSGCCICLALLSLISVLIVRRKKSQLKYDQEKAEGNTEESRKLKEATETEKGNSS